MAEQFYTILTNTGKAKIANSLPTGQKLNLVKMKIGDSNGNYYNPSENQTDLVHKIYECNITNVEVDAVNPQWITITAAIPSDVGGFNIREVGVFDDTNSLIAIGKYPETYKPVAADGSTKELYIKMTLEVTNAASVALKIDPTVILATKKDVANIDTKIEQVNTQLLESVEQMNSVKINVLYPPLGLLPLVPNNTSLSVATENKARLLAMFTFFTDKTVTLVFPNGVYSLINGIRITSNFSLRGAENNGSSVLLDVSDVSSETTFITFGATNAETTASTVNKIWGGTINNLTVRGQYQKHDALVFMKTGWEGRHDDLRIENFLGSGYKALTAFDTNIYSLTISNCGGKWINSSSVEVVKYALELDKIHSDVTNAHHFFGLHIENCRYMTKINNARHNQFIGCKWEQESTHVNSDNINPPILIDENAMETTFSACMFIPTTIGSWQSVNDSSFIPPYFIDCKNTINWIDNITKFIGCDFTPNGGDGGAMVVKSIAPIFINNCKFNGIVGNHGIYLDSTSAKLINSLINSFAYKGTINKAIYINNGIAIGNNINNIGNGTYSNSSYGIKALGSAIIKENKIATGFEKQVEGNDSYADYARCSTIVSRQGTGVINNANIANMIDSDGNYVLDLEKLPRYSTFIFNFGSAISIKGIKGGFGSEEITLFNNTSNIVTLIWNNNVEGQTIMLNKPTQADISSFVIKANSCITLKYLSWGWKELQRSFYEW